MSESAEAASSLSEGTDNSPGLHPMCPANAYTLVRATLHCQDTVGIMLLDFLCLTKPSKRAVRRE